MLTKIQRFSFSFSLCFHFKHYLTLYEYLCMCSPRISSNMVILAYFLQLPLNTILCTKNAKKTPPKKQLFLIKACCLEMLKPASNLKAA